MGYPMTYQRVIKRNYLAGDYSDNITRQKEFDELIAALLHIGWEKGNTYWKPDTLISTHSSRTAGDLRRLEKDQRDEDHLALYAKHAGITPEQAKKVLDLFFEGFPEPGYRIHI